MSMPAEEQFQSDDTDTFANNALLNGDAAETQEHDAAHDQDAPVVADDALPDTGVDDVLDFSDAPPDESEDMRAMRLKYDQKLQRITNKLKRDAEQNGSGQADQLKQALGQMLMDPETKGPVIDQLRQRFGITPNAPSQEQSAIAKMRREKMALVDPEVVEPFSALTEHVVEERYMPLVRQEIQRLRSEIAELFKDRTSSELTRLKATYPQADKHLAKAAELKEAVERGGGQITLEQALLAASNGKIMADKKQSDQRRVVKHAASETPSSPAPEPATRKNGTHTKPDAEAVLRSFLKKNPNSRKTVEATYGLNRFMG